jgi:hypothetical protein
MGHDCQPAAGTQKVAIAMKSLQVPDLTRVTRKYRDKTTITPQKMHTGDLVSARDHYVFHLARIVHRYRVSRHGQ